MGDMNALEKMVKAVNDTGPQLMDEVQKLVKRHYEEPSMQVLMAAIITYCCADSLLRCNPTVLAGFEAYMDATYRDGESSDGTA